MNIDISMQVTSAGQTSKYVRLIGADEILQICTNIDIPVGQRGDLKNAGRAGRDD